MLVKKWIKYYISGTRSKENYYLLVITINSSNGEKKALITANFIGNEFG